MGSRARITTAYLAGGAIAALWTAALPATDRRLDLGPGTLGVVLAAVAVGGLLAMAGTGALAQRGMAPSVRATLVAAAAALVLTALSPSTSGLIVAATAFGAATGVLNVLLNLAAVAAERASDRPLMASLHGCWAIGAVAGGAALALGQAAGAGAPALMVAGAVVVAVLGVVVGPLAADSAAALGTSRACRRDVDAGGAPGTDVNAPRVPAVVVVALGLLGAAAFVVEGAATEWSGVHATRELGVGPGLAAWSYVGFFACMTVVRLCGAALQRQLSPTRILRIAGGTTAIAHVAVLASSPLPHAWQRLAVAGLGWALAGVGIALVWPTVTSAVGVAVRSPATLSAVTTISYAGGLAGPALLGIVAEHAGIRAALVLPALLAVVIAVAGPLVLGGLHRRPSMVSTPHRQELPLSVS